MDELQLKAASQKFTKQHFSKIVLHIEILEKTGSRVGLPYSKHIGNGVWELRPNDYRIFFFVWNGNYIVLLHTFRKKTKKTPLREIQRAEKEKSDWIQNGNKCFTDEN